MTPGERETQRLPAGITREALERDQIRGLMRARHPEVALIDDAELRDSMRATLAARPESVRDGAWLFAYGSLLWNPCVEIDGHRPARLYGYHRDFPLKLTYGRGSPEAPGLMLGLAPGGSCGGVALRVPARRLERELMLVWRREMLTGVYRPRWLRLKTAAGDIMAIAFVVNPFHPCFCGRLDDDAVVELLATGEGVLGTSAEYLENTVAHLEEQGVHDRRLRRLRAQVLARRHGHRVEASA